MGFECKFLYCEKLMQIIHVKRSKYYNIFALKNDANDWHVFPGGGWGDHMGPSQGKEPPASASSYNLSFYSS